MWQIIKRHWVLVLSLLYFLSPIDLIPELLVFVLGPGVIIDDISILVLGIGYAIYKEWQLRKQIPAKPERQVIEGEVVSS